MKKIEIDRNSQLPVYRQLIKSIEDLLATGAYSEGDFLPSMNELSEDLEISRETVKKAYSILREKKLIGSAQGKGFYIKKAADGKHKILVIFDKLSTYKQVLFSSFENKIGEQSEITILLHNQDIALFEYYIQENLDHYDYYIITPHFPLAPEIQKRVIKNLKKVPNRKLILLDRNMEELPGNYAAVYQDFAKDITEGLHQASGLLKNFSKLNVMSGRGSLYAPLIIPGITRFCQENSMDFEVFTSIDPDKIKAGEVYLILNSQLDQELIEVIRIARERGCNIGKDIGIISYNEAPINNIILEGLSVFSTDFTQMGELAAGMILQNSFRKTRCNFQLIKRNTF